MTSKLTWLERFVSTIETTVSKTSSEVASCQPLLTELENGILTVDNLSHQVISLLNAIEKVDPLKATYASADDKIKAVTACLDILCEMVPQPTQMCLEILIKEVVPAMVNQYHNVSRTPSLSLFQAQNGSAWIHHKPIKPAHVSTKTNRKYALRKSLPDARDYKLQLTKPKTLPSHVDFRETKWMPPVLDQGQIGSCGAHAAANALHFLLSKEGHEWSPSRLFIYYITRVYIEHTPATEDSGVMLRDVCKALKAYHCCHEQLMPYSDTATAIAKPPSAVAVADAKLHKQLKYMAVNQTLNDIKTALVANQPIILGLQIYSSFEADATIATGQVPMPNMDTDQLLGGHALFLMFYDDATRQFGLCNSWSSDVGDKGIFYVPFQYILDSNLCSDLWTFEFFD